MISVLLNGCNGNMGNELAKCINTSNKFSIVCGVDKNSSINNTFPIYSNLDDITETFDVIIDFSAPVSSINILNYAKVNNIPIVIATTGFNTRQLAFIKECSRSIPIFKSSNMSFEISIMNLVVSKLSQLLSDNDIEIIETHHKNKVDAPSGTALMLANTINSSRNHRMTFTYNRTNYRVKRSRNEIGIHSVRGGTEVGKHTVLFLGNNESFELTHTVSSRSIFATGALKAASFIIKQSAGLYGMNDMIKFDFLL